MAKDHKSGEENICITGGASQNLACVLQVYSDPKLTTVWMVAPCYYLACNIFADAGLEMRAVGQGKDGIDLIALEEGMKRVNKEGKKMKVCNSLLVRLTRVQETGDGVTRVVAKATTPCVLLLAPFLPKPVLGK